MQTEWMKCPRCKNKPLRPELIGTDPGGTKMWWVCENYNTCLFPLDMPANIFTVIQTPFQKQDGYIPMPKIPSIPLKYRYLYPITFADSQRSSRASSMVSTKPGSKSDTIYTSESGSVSDKSSEKSRLKADVVGVQSDVTVSAITSSSDPSEAVGDNDNIDEEVEDASRKRSVTYRTMPRKRYLDTTRSWVQLIEKVACDEHTSDAIINMEESELFARMKEFFDDKYFKGAGACFRRFPRRVNYRFDDVENCLWTVTQEDWEKARKRLPQMSINARAALKTVGGVKLLKTVGINVQQRRKAIGEKVEKVMRGFSSGNMVKRQKIQEKREQEKQEKNDSIKNDIHQSVSAMILNRKRIRDDEERSQASTPSNFCLSEPTSPHPSSSRQEFPEEHYEAAPVHFHLGNEVYAQNPQYPPYPQQEEESNWGFDLDGLYESIHSQNRVQDDHNPLDPVEALLFPADDNPVQDLPPVEDPGVESGDEQPEDEDEDPFAGYDDFSGLGNSNTDFVNDTFGF